MLKIVNRGCGDGSVATVMAVQASGCDFGFFAPT